MTFFCHALSSFFNCDASSGIPAVNNVIHLFMVSPLSWNDSSTIGLNSHEKHEKTRKVEDDESDPILTVR